MRLRAGQAMPGAEPARFDDVEGSCGVLESAASLSSGTGAKSSGNGQAADLEAGAALGLKQHEEEERGVQSQQAAEPEGQMEGIRYDMQERQSAYCCF